MLGKPTSSACGLTLGDLNGRAPASVQDAGAGMPQLGSFHLEMPLLPITVAQKNDFSLFRQIIELLEFPPCFST